MARLHNQGNLTPHTKAIIAIAKTTTNKTGRQIAAELGLSEVTVSRIKPEQLTGAAQITYQKTISAWEHKLMRNTTKGLDKTYEMLNKTGADSPHLSEVVAATKFSFEAIRTLKGQTSSINTVITREQQIERIRDIVNRGVDSGVSFEDAVRLYAEQRTHERELLIEAFPEAQEILAT